MVEKSRVFNIASVLAFPYTMSVALGWMLGFWQSFGVNPFEYAGPSGIASISAYAFAASLSTLLVTGLLTYILLKSPAGTALNNWIDNRFERMLGPVPKLPPEDGCKPEELADYCKTVSDLNRKLRKRLAKMIMVRSLIAFVFVLSAYTAYLQKSPILLGILAVSSIFFFLLVDPIPEWIKDAFSRSAAAEIVLCVMIALPVTAFLHGAQKAFQIKEGKGAMLLFGTATQGTQKGGVYVGRIGSHVFTYNICSKRTDIIKDDELPRFRLVSNALAQCFER